MKKCIESIVAQETCICDERTCRITEACIKGICVKKCDESALSYVPCYCYAKEQEPVFCQDGEICERDDQEQECMGQSLGYFEEIVFCNSREENCRICENGECIACDYGYYLEHGGCLPCQSQEIPCTCIKKNEFSLEDFSDRISVLACQECASDENCQSCINQHYFDGDLQRCIQCGDEQGFCICGGDSSGNCKRCADEFSNKCASCFDGYYLGQYRTCELSNTAIMNETFDCYCGGIPLQGCRACAGNACGQCGYGYYLLNGECVKCEPDCYECDQSRCLECNPGRIIYEGKCLECGKNEEIVENNECKCNPHFFEFNGSCKSSFIFFTLFGICACLMLYWIVIMVITYKTRKSHSYCWN